MDGEQRQIGFEASNLSFATDASAAGGIFALAHLMPVLWPGAFLFGIGAACYRERSDSLTPYVVVHMLNSAAFITASYVFSGWNVVKMF